MEGTRTTPSAPRRRQLTAIAAFVREHHTPAFVAGDAVEIETEWSRLLPDGSYETGFDVHVVRTMHAAREVLGY